MHFTNEVVCLQLKMMQLFHVNQSLLVYFPPYMCSYYLKEVEKSQPRVQEKKPKLFGLGSEFCFRKLGSIDGIYWQKLV